MSWSLEAIEVAALQLSREDRERLIDALIASLEPLPVEMPEHIAKAWELEIARRVEEMDAGLVESIPYEQVMAELRAKIEAHGKR